MGSSLPGALTLPCGEEEPQRAKERKPKQPSCSSLGEGDRPRGWLGAEAGASTAGITFSFPGRWEGRKPRAHLNCPTPISRYFHSLSRAEALRGTCKRRKCYVSAATVLKAVGTSPRKAGKMGHPPRMALVMWAEVPGGAGAKDGTGGNQVSVESEGGGGGGGGDIKQA